MRVIHLHVRVPGNERELWNVFLPEYLRAAFRTMLSNQLGHSSYEIMFFHAIRSCVEETGWRVISDICDDDCLHMREGYALLLSISNSNDTIRICSFAALAVSTMAKAEDVHRYNNETEW
ncbi:hypothetical protein FPOAC2_11477 [Fusarium poae]|jgi:hypothetical protein